MPYTSIDSLLAEVEWLLADDRWTEEEFTRIWRAALAAAGNDGAALQPLLAHADHSWLARVLPSEALSAVAAG
jgi:hypothetical protein